MRIAIDISPLENGHKVRGVGFYLTNLKNALKNFFSNNTYIFFTQKDKLPINVDLIHFPYFEPFYSTLPFYTRIKTIVTVHDLTPLVFPKSFPVGIKGFIIWQIQRLKLRKVSAIITDSVSSKKDIERIVGIPSDKIHIVYLAANEEFKNKKFTVENLNEIKKKYKLPQKFALYVGDVTWNKNLPRLVSAVIKANIPLVMVGKALISDNFDRSHPWNSDLVQIQTLTHKNTNIIRLGFIPNHDLIGIYRLATVFVMPSLYEGFGLPIIEAMSAGCPVITSHEGSLPEVGGDAVLYVNAYDIDSIAKGIQEIFHNEALRKKLRQKGLEQSTKFSWEKTARETCKVYESVMEQKV